MSFIETKGGRVSLKFQQLVEQYRLEIRTGEAHRSAEEEMLKHHGRKRPAHPADGAR